MRWPAKKRLPALRKLLAKKPSEPQTWQQQLAIAKQMTLMMGGKIVKPQGET